MKFYDLDIQFELNEPSRYGYERVFQPFFLTDRKQYQRDKINIQIVKDDSKWAKADLYQFENWRFDINLMSRIRDKGGYVEFPLDKIRKTINRGGIERIKLFSKVVRAYKIPFIFTNGVNREELIRSPKEIAFVGEFLGFSQRSVLRSMSDRVEELMEIKNWI